jgi:hypothetical protein
MLIERQISIAIAGVSAALVVPAYTPLFTDKTAAAAGSPVALLIGTVLGALAVLMGLLVSTGDLEGAAGPLRVLSLVKVVLWSTLAICLSAGTGAVAMHAPGIGWRIGLTLASLAPLAAAAMVVLHCRSKS